MTPVNPGFCIWRQVGGGDWSAESHCSPGFKCPDQFRGQKLDLTQPVPDDIFKAFCSDLGVEVKPNVRQVQLPCVRG
jgi:hypothetical protein